MLTLLLSVVLACRLSDAQNCVFAPSCPQFVAWTPGYICDDGFFAVIKKRDVGGAQMKTICCSEVTSCAPWQFWCSQSDSSDGFNVVGGNSAALAPSCSLGCVTQWKPYGGDSAPLIDGIAIDGSSYVGRVRVFETFQPGRITPLAAGIRFTFHGEERHASDSVEYLASNANYSYEWTRSENGSRVANAVTLNVPRSASQYVGRVSSEGRFFVGTVVRVMGGMFYGDGEGVERFTSRYEVLTCTLAPPLTTLAPPPTCPVFWRGHSTYLATASPLASTIIVNARNGILIGEDVHTYVWYNRTTLTDLEVVATLVMPGGIRHHIGRIFVNGETIIGTVDIDSGMMQYTDGFGVVRTALCYEVLGCWVPGGGGMTVAPGTTTSDAPTTLSSTLLTDFPPSSTQTSETSTAATSGSTSATSSEGDLGTTTTTAAVDSNSTATVSSSTTSKPNDGTTPSGGEDTTTTTNDGSGSSTTVAAATATTATTTTSGSGGSTGTTPGSSSSSTTLPSEGKEEPLSTTPSATSTGSTTTTTIGDSSTTAPSQGGSNSTPSPSATTTTTAMSTPNGGESTTPTTAASGGGPSTTSSGDSNATTTTTTWTTVSGSGADTTPSSGTGASSSTPGGSMGTTPSGSEATTTTTKAPGGSTTTSSDGGNASTTTTTVATTTAIGSAGSTTTVHSVPTGSSTEATNPASTTVSSGGATSTTGAQYSSTSSTPGSSYLPPTTTLPTTDSTPFATTTTTTASDSGATTTTTTTTVAHESTSTTSPASNVTSEGTTATTTASVNATHATGTSASPTTAGAGASTTSGAGSSTDVTATTTPSSNSGSDTPTTTSQGISSQTTTMTTLPYGGSSTPTPSVTTTVSGGGGAVTTTTFSSGGINETTTTMTPSSSASTSSTATSSGGGGDESTTTTTPEVAVTTPTPSDGTVTTTTAKDSGASTRTSDSGDTTTPSVDSTTTTTNGNNGVSTTPTSQHTTVTTRPTTTTTTTTTTTAWSDGTASTTKPSTHSSEISSLPFTTPTLPWYIVNSTTTTTTPIPTDDQHTTLRPKTCIVRWRNYTGHEDLPQVAVTARITSLVGAYVGQSSVYGNILPGIISFNTTINEYCFFFGTERCIESFQFLENNDDYTYTWLDSQNGAFVPNAIEVQTFYVGRIMTNGTLYLGTVVPGYGMVYVDNLEQKWHYSNKSYQVLSCVAAPPPPLYDCSQEWKPYVDGNAPALEGVSVQDDSNATFVGRATYMTDFVIGKLQTPPLQPGLLFYNYGSFALETATAEYLVEDPTFAYTWIESSFGLPVEYALSVRKSSAYWPMYVGRVQLNATFVLMGRVLPSRGLIYLDSSGVEHTIHHYQVLTCTSPTPICESDCVRKLKDGTHFGI